MLRNDTAMWAGVHWTLTFYCLLITNTFKLLPMHKNVFTDIIASDHKLIDVLYI